MKQALFLFVSLGLLVHDASGQTGIFVPAMGRIDTMIKEFTYTWGIQGGAVAITKGGRLVYNRGFGYLDANYTDKTQPYNRFRIASVSKPITAIAIMKLLGSGQIMTLDDIVFGIRPGILSDSIFLKTHKTPLDSTRRSIITVRHLLEHGAGWNRELPCYGNSGCDPITFPLLVDSITKMPNPAGDSAYITFLIQKGFDFEPGTSHKYSNIGYSTLGIIIERLSGQKYDELVTDSIFRPLGLCDFAMLKNKLADKQERESEYISTGRMPDCYGNGTPVPLQYGGYNMESFKGAGGWIGTAAELARVLVSVDGYGNVPDILSLDLLDTMITPTGTSSTYAKGWEIKLGLYGHDGSMPGTSAYIMVRAADSVAMAFVFSKRSSGGYATALRALANDSIKGFVYPSHDLFAPQTNITDLKATPIIANALSLKWTNGSGDWRIVTATELPAATPYPEDGTGYAGNTRYGLGTMMDAKTYVVYSGQRDTTIVTDLDAHKSYRFTAYEGRGTGAGWVYKIGCRSQLTVNLAATNISTSTSDALSIYPNPVKESCTIIAGSSLWHTNASLCDIAGKEVAAVRISGRKQDLSTSNLAPGIYFMHFANGAVFKLVRE